MARETARLNVIIQSRLEEQAPACSFRTAFRDCKNISQSAYEVSCRARMEIPVTKFT